MAKSFWDTEKIIATLPKNDRGEEIHRKLLRGKRNILMLEPSIQRITNYFQAKE